MAASRASSSYMASSTRGEPTETVFMLRPGGGAGAGDAFVKLRLRGSCDEDADDEEDTAFTPDEDDEPVVAGDDDEEDDELEDEEEDD